ncbi:MAG: hypothetical protein ACJ8DI_11455 [Ktedonobacteraceae bacterium]
MSIQRETGPHSMVVLLQKMIPGQELVRGDRLIVQKRNWLCGSISLPTT